MSTAKVSAAFKKQPHHSCVALSAEPLICHFSQQGPCEGDVPAKTGMREHSGGHERPEISNQTAGLCEVT